MTEWGVLLLAACIAWPVVAYAIGAREREER